MFEVPSLYANVNDHIWRFSALPCRARQLSATISIASAYQLDSIGAYMRTPVPMYCAPNYWFRRECALCCFLCRSFVIIVIHLFAACYEMR